MKNLFYIVFLIAALIVAGCVSENQNTPTTPTPQIIYVTVLVTPTPAAVSEIPAATSAPETVTITTPPANATPTLQQAKMPGGSDPRVEEFQTTVQNYGISDCVMKQVFPEIANDPEYGITSGHSKLKGISSERWNKFYSDYETGQNTGQSSTFSVSKCAGVPVNFLTSWDFVSITARLTPQNARPSDYEIIVTLNSHGRPVSQIITSEMLTYNEPLTIVSWVPVRKSEVNDLGTPTISFNRLTNT